MTTNQAQIDIEFSSLPLIGTDLHGGTFAGITTTKDGQHQAVVLLPETATKLTWRKAMNWAAKLDAELPSRPVASMLFANVKDKLPNGWHWTSEQDDASYAWLCGFAYGYIYGYHKSYEGGVVSVRLIPIAA